MTIAVWVTLIIIVTGVGLALTVAWVVPTRGDHRASWPGSQAPDADPPVKPPRPLQGRHRREGRR